MSNSRTKQADVKVYFSDFFKIPSQTIEDYGAFNISLVSDIPLFIDPFLLFNSKKKKYQELHSEIIQYLKFIREVAHKREISQGHLRGWFYFSEVSQTWLGYSGVGNSGRGLGRTFANALFKNLHTIFSNFGAENITKESHLEKLCLVTDGVGKDSISDFTTNLIKAFLLEYTQEFATQYIDPKLRTKLMVDRVRFNYTTETWEREEFDLPYYNNDYVLLTPKDILTRENTWINRGDLRNPDSFYKITTSVSNEQLRAEINNYYRKLWASTTISTGKKPKKAEREKIVSEIILKYPQLIDYYIKFKEETGDTAETVSEQRVQQAHAFFVDLAQQIVTTLANETDFYSIADNTYQETHSRVQYLKDVIENKGGHRLFYIDGKPVRKESDLQIMFRLVWFATVSDVTSEANDGRGPVDFKISRGAFDKTLAEFKLARNSQLKRNLEKQTDVYEKASDADKSVKVIIYFNVKEQRKVQRILDQLGLTNSDDVVLIDARNDNKPSGSKA